MMPAAILSAPLSNKLDINAAQLDFLFQSRWLIDC